MTNHNAIRLLGLTAILCAVPFGLAFAVITNASGVIVTAPAQPNVNSVNVSWTSASTDDEPTDGALVGHYVEISGNGFANIIESVFIPAPAVSTSFSSLQPDTPYDVRVIANFATAGNQTAATGSGSTNPDITDPVVTGSVTNVNDGGNTELTATDQYAESCTSTDNDVFFVDNCAVASGGIDTSVLGLQSVTYEATDAATNTGSDTVSTTVQDTTSPVISDPVAGQSGVKGILFTDNEAGVSATDLTAVVISAELFAPNATSMQTVPNIATGTISFTPDVSGAWSITYTATDTSSNTDTVTKTVTISLGDAPVIILTGANPQVINLHDAYVELGATASDTEDGDLTGSIAIDASAVDVDTLGSYIVTYDVTDSSGNTDHEERTVNVVTGGIPVITILGSANTGIEYSGGYTDAGFTATDAEDGDLTASIIVSGYPFDTWTEGDHIITATVTDSNGNTVSATRTVTVAKPSSGNWCSGDCIPPTIGLDSDGRRMVEWPVTYKTGTVSFSQLAEYYHTPMEDFVVNVGDTNTLKFVIYENSGYDAIRQVGLSIGVPFSGTFNDGAAQIRWYAAPLGKVVEPDTQYIEETDPDNIFERITFSTERVECSPAKTGNDSCMGVIIAYKFREAPKDTAIRLDIWDEKLNAFQHVLNEGVTVTGASLNGPDTFQSMASDGRMYTLTTENDFATDQNGDRWSPVNGFWTRDFVAPDNTGSKSKWTGYDRNDAEFAGLKDSEAADAKSLFDSAKLQKEPKPAQETAYPKYDRLHDPVPNMMKAQVDYVLSRANHS